MKLKLLKHRLVKNTLVFIIFTVISKITGFAREVALAYRFGTSAESDIYVVATTIPVFMFMIVGSAISVAYIPILAEHKKNESRFFSNIFTIFTSAISVLALIGILLSPILIKILSPGFDASQHQRAVDLCRIVFPYIIIICAISIMSGTLQSKNRFAATASIGIPFNIIVVLSLLFVTLKYGLPGLGVSILIAGFSQFFLVFIAFTKLKIKYVPMFDFKSSGLLKMIFLFMPIFFELAIWQINIMVDRNLASRLVEGSIAALNYAGTVNGFAIGVFIAGAATALHPELSGFYVSRNYSAIRNLVMRSINILLIILIPCQAGLIILKDPIVSLLFQRGAFDDTAVSMTSRALMFYSAGLFCFGARSILSRTFMALQSSKTSLLNGMITVSVNIILNLILIKRMGIGGLALASSLSVLISTLIYIIILKKRIGDFGISKITKTFIISLTAAGFMGFFVYLIYNTLSNYFVADIIPLILSIIAGALIYFGILKLLFIITGDKNWTLSSLGEKEEPSDEKDHN